MSSELLKTCYLFKDMTDDQLLMLRPALSFEAYVPGDEIFAQNEVAQAMYLLKTGTVRVLSRGQKGGNIEIAKLPTGALFGEMAFLDEETRSATVEVVESAEVLRVDYEKLRSMLTGHPVIAVKFLSAMALFLCERLRKTTNDLSFARELNVKHF